MHDGSPPTVYTKLVLAVSRVVCTADKVTAELDHIPWDWPVHTWRMAPHMLQTQAGQHTNTYLNL